MRKIIVSEMISADGYFAGPHGELDWHNVDAEFNAFADAQLEKADTLIFGRKTYDLMVSWWPTVDTIEDDPVIANKMNTLDKVVFSRTMNSAPWGAWNNARVEKGDLIEAVTKMKQDDGKDILIFGSGSIVSALAHTGLIDEYRLIVAPVVLGAGIPLFQNLSSRLNLKLVSAKPCKNGNVILAYAEAADGR